MNLKTKAVNTWPKLAWVAQFAGGADAVTVWHGPCVETAPDWIVEAVWAGPFETGDFDRTDLVFGTGVRVRGDRVTFVSSGSTLDRLWYCRHGQTWTVSNSLPGLLAMGGLALREDYANYPHDLYTVMNGLDACVKALPADPVDVRVVYFRNLVYAGGALTETDKPDAATQFTAFASYHDFLVQTAHALAVNLGSASRRCRIAPLTSISSGYDSPATAVIAKHAGCSQAVTIADSSSLWRGSDSGEAVARRLGLVCRTYRQVRNTCPHEEAVWAATGRPGDLNLTLFDYPEPLCLFFSGYHGDRVWGRSRQTVTDPFAGAGFSGRGFGEWRLLRGVFHCPVPFWAYRHITETRAISFSPEMEPWVLNNDYDRPIARRLIEEAGVPRGTFAVRKKNTSHEAPFLWPYSREARASFRAYLAERGVRIPSDSWIQLARRLSLLGHLVNINLFRPLGLRFRVRELLRRPGPNLLFQWANHEIKKVYEKGLAAAGKAETTSPPGS